MYARRLSNSSLPVASCSHTWRWMPLRAIDSRDPPRCQTVFLPALLAEVLPDDWRRSCGVELLRLSGGNLRAVQEHLRHADIQPTTAAHAVRLAEGDQRVRQEQWGWK